MKKSKIISPVEHFFNGKQSWIIGWGFLTRVRGLLTLVLANVFLGGGIFAWWQYVLKPFSKQQLSLVWVIIGVAVFAAVSFSGIIATWYYIRRRRQQSLELDYLLHNLVHDMRDHTVAINIRPHNANADSFRSFFNHTCGGIRDYFCKLLRTDDVECAIRMADKPPENSQIQEFHTLGRSSGLETSGRAHTSVPIPSNKGVISFFAARGGDSTEHDCRGVLIYHDIEKSEEIGAFFMTPNDRKFINEVRTMMVAPINGFDGTQKSMLGVVYVTSSKDIFSARHVDAFRGIADALGLGYSMLINAF